MNKKLAAVGLLCAFMAACGGSGDDAPAPAPSPAPAPAPSPAPSPAPAPAPSPAPAPTPAPSPEGQWAGKTSTGFDTVLTVLENGEVWGFYVNSAASNVGALHGAAMPNGLQVSGALTDFNFISMRSVSVNYTGTFAPKTRLDIQAISGSMTLAAGYVTTYDQPASQAAIVGTYSGAGLTTTVPMQSIPITISSTGVATMPAINGCSASGTVQPRPTGKNVYDVTVTFQGSSCAIGNGVTTRGIGIYANGSLILEALNGAKTDGFFYVGTKN